MTREELGINEWLELIKEDKNLKGAYICISQYLYIAEKENKELKEKLDKYENPEDMTLMMMWCTEKVKDENEKLKEELEDMTLCRDIASGHRQEVQNRETILLRQQKKFIKYLEDEINNITTQYSQVNGSYFLLNDKIKMFESVLQKYKEIVNGSEHK